jgi:hypothetical protein
LSTDRRSTTAMPIGPTRDARIAKTKDVLSWDSLDDGLILALVMAALSVAG